ncbi:MAG: VTT domain-containing protein [Pseudomonadota bacterium]
MTVSDTAPKPVKPSLKRFLPIGVLGLGALLGLTLAGDYLSFEAIERNYEGLLAWRDQNLVLAALAFAGLYVVATAFSIPGAIWLTLIGGLLFGLYLGTALVLVGATIGATLVFLAARTSFGALLREKAGGWIHRLEAQFKEGEVSLLLIMRLVPAVPFFIANLAPAFLGVRLATFVWTTALGIVPGTVVYISIGAGLGEQLARGESPDLGVIFEPHVLGPLLGLAVLAALPLVLKRLGLRRPG